MAGSLNRVSLIGTLGRDPEVRALGSGAKVVNLRIATSGQWRDRESGEKKERTEWHSVVIWAEGLAKVAEQYLRKGSKVMVEGRLETRKWQDQGGADRYSTEVVLRPYQSELILLGDPRGERSDDGERSAGGGEPSRRDNGARPDSRPRITDGGFDDEIPF